MIRRLIVPLSEALYILSVIKVHCHKSHMLFSWDFSICVTIVIFLSSLPLFSRSSLTRSHETVLIKPAPLCHEKWWMTFHFPQRHESEHHEQRREQKPDRRETAGGEEEDCVEKILTKEVSPEIEEDLSKSYWNRSLPVSQIGWISVYLIEIKV